MNKILFSGQDKTVFKTLENIFSERGISTRWMDSGQKTISAISGENYELVILQEDQPDMTCKKLIEQIIMINAMINCVVLSSVPEEEFHEIYEGLGVLMKLSLTPDKEDADKITSYLDRINAMGSHKK